MYSSLKYLLEEPRLEEFDQRFGEILHMQRGDVIVDLDKNYVGWIFIFIGVRTITQFVADISTCSNLGVVGQSGSRPRHHNDNDHLEEYAFPRMQCMRLSSHMYLIDNRPGLASPIDTPL